MDYPNMYNIKIANRIGLTKIAFVLPAVTNALAWGGAALGYKGLESLFFS